MAPEIRITRRNFVLAGGAFLTLPAMCLRGAESKDPVKSAETAYIWGLPLVLINHYRTLATTYPINRFTLSTRLSSPEDKVAAPNVDTLYGFSFLDVSKEPLILHVPDTNDRYYSIHLIDAYQNSFAYVGRRSTGTREGDYAITPPGWAGQLPGGVKKIESPTAHLLALTRTLVRGEQDLPAAQAIQLQYTLRALSTYHSAAALPQTTSAAFNVFPYLDLSSSGVKFVEELNAAISVDPPSSREKAPLEAFSIIGVGNPSSVGTASQTALQQGTAQANQRITQADFATDVNGWKVNYRIANFMEDPLLRASVSRVGPGAHVAKEALYFAARTDHEGKPLRGENRYRIRFPEGGLPPVDAFWSLILYGSDYALVRNSLRRYSISDRTQGLLKNGDGSLTISVQADAPENTTTNWLPAPKDKFSLILRTYQPRPELFDGRYKVPAIERI